MTHLNKMVKDDKDMSKTELALLRYATEIDWFPNKKEIRIGREIIKYSEIEIHQICAVVDGEADDLCLHIDSYLGTREGIVEIVLNEWDYCYVYGMRKKNER